VTTAKQRLARVLAAHKTREKQRARLEAMTFEAFRELWHKLNRKHNRYQGRVMSPPPDEVLQAMYDDRLVAFDEDS
jgi:restriction endonuclease